MTDIPDYSPDPTINYAYADGYAAGIEAAAQDAYRPGTVVRCFMNEYEQYCLGNILEAVDRCDYEEISTAYDALRRVIKSYWDAETDEL